MRSSARAEADLPHLAHLMGRLERSLQAYRETRRAFPRCPENAVHRGPRGQRVLIVGAGLSGLTAGLELLDRGFQVDIFERSTVVGGRLMSWRDRELGLGRPVPLERATHGVWWTYNDLRELLHRHGIGLRERWVNAAHTAVPIIGLDGRARRLEVGRHLPSLLHGLPFWQSARHELLRPGDRLGLRQLLALMAFDGSPAAVERYDALTATAWAASVGLPEGLVSDFINPLLEMCNFQGAATSSALAWHRFSSSHFADWRDLRITQFFDGPASEALMEPLVARFLARGGALHLGAQVDSLVIHDQRIAGLNLVSRAQPSAICPACHRHGTSPCRGCGYRGEDFLHPAQPGGFVAANAVMVAVALPAARELLLKAPLAGLPFFAKLARLPTANPVIVYLRIPRDPAMRAHEPNAWQRAHGSQEVLFTTRFPTLGTVINTAMLHAGRMDPALDIIEVDLARGERFDHLADLELVALVEADLRRLVPHLPPSAAHRVLRWRDFTTCEVGSEALRPTVQTPIDGLQLLGDWVRVPQNCYYMERCVVSARLAVNHLLASGGGEASQQLTILPSETPSLPLALVRWLAGAIAR